MKKTMHSGGLIAVGMLALLVVSAAAAPALARDQDKVSKKASTQLKLAQSLYLNGRLGEALSAVDRSIEEESKYVLAHQLRGQILFAMDAMDKALEEFDEAIRIDAEATDSRNWRATTLVQLKRYDDAMAEYRRAVEDLTYPNPEKLYLNIGMLHRLMGDVDAAIASLEKAVNLNPSYGRGYYELGLTYEAEGRYREALRSYRDALVGMEESPDLNLRLGLALLRDGDSPKARQHLEKVVKLAPESEEAERARDTLEKIEQTEKKDSPS